MSFFADNLFTRRLVLRKLQLADVPLIVEWSHSPSACGEYLTPGRQDLEHTRWQVQTGGLWSDLEKMFLVETKEGNRPIGTAHYWLVPGGRNAVAMALKIAVPEERGKGYGTEIQKFLILHIFDCLSVNVVEMYTDINNFPQQRCLAKLGFELIESLVYDDHAEKRTGYLYRLSRDCFRSLPIYKFHYE